MARTSVKVLGTEIGTADGWDQADALTHIFYNFIPAAKWLSFFSTLIDGDLFINYETGEFNITKEIRPAEHPHPAKLVTFSGRFPFLQEP